MHMHIHLRKRWILGLSTRTNRTSSAWSCYKPKAREWERTRGGMQVVQEWLAAAAFIDRLEQPCQQQPLAPRGLHVSSHQTRPSTPPRQSPKAYPPFTSFSPPFPSITTTPTSTTITSTFLLPSSTRWFNHINYRRQPPPDASWRFVTSLYFLLL